MTETRFTPGEWKAWCAPDGTWLVRAQYFDAGLRHTAFIATVKCGAQNDEANALVMASTPDLHAACQMLVDSYSEEQGAYGLGALYQARQAASRALAKARGEKSS